LHANVKLTVDLDGRLSESTSCGQCGQSEQCFIFPLSCLKVPTGCQDFSSIKVSKVVGLQLHNGSRIHSTIFLHGTHWNSTAAARQNCSHKSCQALLHAVAFAMHNSTLE